MLEIARLEKQAALLDECAFGRGAPRFDLERWGKIERRRGGILWLQKVECGTAACAIGLACFAGTFASEGLSYVIEGDEISLRYGHLEDWDAVTAFFGLSIRQASRLFAAEEYMVSEGPIAAASVAGRIRLLIKRSRSAKISRAVKKIKMDSIEGAKEELAPLPTHREVTSG